MMPEPPAGCPAEPMLPRLPEPRLPEPQSLPRPAMLTPLAMQPLPVPLPVPLPLPLPLPPLLSAAACADLAVRADACTAALPQGDPALQPSSGSMRLAALGRGSFDALLAQLWRGPAGEALRALLGDGPLCLVSQCWVRRQHPPALRPPGQFPHQWHQDGALGCRFDAAAACREALAPITTLWVPLVDCGEDAPSLEWIDAPLERVLQPAELTDDAVDRQFGTQPRQQARLAAGTGLVFGPGLLHRTHVTPAMSRRRISLEWRFVPDGSLPPRLQHEAVCPIRG